MRLRSVDGSRLGPWLVVNFEGSPTIATRINSLCKGSTRPLLNLEILSQLLICLPPAGEQERILKAIEMSESSLDNVAQSIESQRRRADRLRQAVLAEAFKGALVPQDPKDEPASVLLERIRAERGIKQAQENAKGEKFRFHVNGHCRGRTNKRGMNL